MARYTRNLILGDGVCVTNFDSEYWQHVQVTAHDVDDGKWDVVILNTILVRRHAIFPAMLRTVIGKRVLYVYVRVQLRKVSLNNTFCL